MIEILEELKKNFHLKKSHIVIMQLLSEEKATADEICERSQIPKGRVYGLLNELINMHLIDKNESLPAVYSMKDLQENVFDFLQYDFSKEVKKRSNLLSLLNKETDEERVAMVGTHEDYDYEVIAMITEANWLKIINRDLSVPWFIQPKDESEFWKVRVEINKRRRTFTSQTKALALLKHRAYVKFYEKKPVEQIMTKATFDAYISVLREVYGEEKIKEWAHWLMEEFKKHKNVKVYVLEDHIQVYNSFTSDKQIMSVLLFGGELNGIKVIGKRVTHLYENMFEELKRSSKPVQEYVRPFL